MRSEPSTAATSGLLSRLAVDPVDHPRRAPAAPSCPRRGTEDPLDVGAERADGPTTRTPPARSGALGVEQVGRAVQCDDGLAGAGAAGDLGDAARGGPDRLVLVALDRRDDVAHLAAAAAGQRGDECSVADDDDVVGRLGDHEVVLGADDLAPGSAARVGAGRPSGRRGWRGRRHGGGGAPVDDERLVVVVAHAEAADVADLALGGGRGIGGEVEAAEDQALVLRVDHRAAEGGGVDERVALEQGRPSPRRRPRLRPSGRGPGPRPGRRRYAGAFSSSSWTRSTWACWCAISPATSGEVLGTGWGAVTGRGLLLWIGDARGAGHGTHQSRARRALPTPRPARAADRTRPSWTRQAGSGGRP